VLRVQVVFFLGEALSPGRRGGGIPWVLFFMCSVSAAQPCPRFLVGKPHHIVVAVQGPLGSTKYVREEAEGRPDRFEKRAG
jgi:hypothetical protein